MGEVRQVVLAGPEAPSRARDFVTRAASGSFDDQRFLDCLRLLVSEVVTNSVRHTGAPEGPVELRVHTACGRVRLEVADEGPGFEPVVRRERSERPGGWGLFLVDRIADRWGVEQERSTRVWLEVGPDAARSSGAC